MNNNLVSYQLREDVLRERERIMKNVVKLVGHLSDEVMGSLVGEVDKVIVVEPTHPTNGEAHEGIEKVVSRVIDQKFGDVLQDISYRIGVLKDVMDSVEGKPHRVTSAHLNLAQHLLDGYAFVSNSPGAGYVAWTDCRIVYEGTDHAVANSNTNMKYIHWLRATPSSFQVGNAKPTLGQHDCLVAINEAGTAVVTMTPGKLGSGGALLDGTVRGSELGTGAVTSAKVAASAIFGSHITSSAVGTTHLGDSAVTSAKIADGHVITGKIAASAVTTDKIAASAVTTDNISANAITSVKIADGAVIGTKIGAGQVATAKLNLATHLLY